MSKVGVIINPMAGRDVRRIVGDAEYVTNFFKINVAKRFIQGLDNIGVDEVIMMPDNCGISEALVEDLKDKISADLNFLDMKPVGDVRDTIIAASLLSKLKVDIIAGFGGDGTLRAIFKGAGRVKLVGVPLGTNNVLSRIQVEPTVLGMLVGLSLKGKLYDVFVPMKILKFIVNGKIVDVALIDMAFIARGTVGAKALWDIDDMLFIVYSKCEPTDVGLASIGGQLYPSSLRDDYGLIVKLHGKSRTVNAIIVPGLVKRISVESFTLLRMGEEFILPEGIYVVAFDGEREYVSSPGDEVKVVLERSGPLLFDASAAINEYIHFLKLEKNYGREFYG
ncbi:MAG: diacylglycerol kinase family protein [Nitrososphaerota archaeon]